MTWHCTLCGDVLWGWLDLANHLRLLHPDLEVGEVEWPTASDVYRKLIPDPSATR